MKFQRSLLPFIIVNIAVSAAAMLIVLAIWSTLRTSTIYIGSQVAASEVPAANATLPPLGKAVLEIENVFGYGDLQSEVVRIRHAGGDPLFLQDWTLQDGDGNIYSFPAITLYSGVVEVYSRSGSNTVISLFWGLKQPVWSQGEVAAIYDPEGNQRSRFQIP
jgi:hypothetical protein